MSNENEKFHLLSKMLMLIDLKLNSILALLTKQEGMNLDQFPLNVKLVDMLGGPGHEFSYHLNPRLQMYDTSGWARELTVPVVPEYIQPAKPAGTTSVDQLNSLLNREMEIEG